VVGSFNTARTCKIRHQSGFFKLALHLICGDDAELLAPGIARAQSPADDPMTLFSERSRAKLALRWRKQLFKLRHRALKSGAGKSNAAGTVSQNILSAGQVLRFSYRAQSLGDVGVIKQIFFNQDYAFDQWPQAQAVLRFYEALLAGGRTPLILDAGANIGASCLHFASLFPASRVIAIEPAPGNCALLRSNCAGRDIEVIEGAIGAGAGTMFLSDPGMSDWGFRVGEDQKAAGQIEVPVLTPNDILARQEESASPFICKIDIEGGEQYLFAKNTEWMSRFAMIVIELHDWMLPHQQTSQPFFRALSEHAFDVLWKGENLFCFNNTALAAYRS
jgi:FkbM family methyltransferase